MYLGGLGLAHWIVGAFEAPKVLKKLKRSAELVAQQIYFSRKKNVLTPLSRLAVDR